MTSQQILQSDMLDILFEKRNKMYGAYYLRRAYNSHLLKAMGGTALFVLALLFIGNSSSEKVKDDKPDPDYQLTPVILASEKKPETPQQKKADPPARKLTQQDIFIDNIEIVDKPDDPIATQQNLLNTTVGSTKVFGPPSTGIPAPPQVPITNDHGKDDDKNETPLPSRQPQFPGGPNAWADFLNRHLRPPQDLEPGEKRMSLIRFSVDEEGVITNFQIVQSGGSEFDNEVIRVLKKMPKWLPALQNGKAMAVSFTQPVTFVAADE